MDILFCNIGEHPFYNGEIDIAVKGGGEWNKEHIGGEINNFTNCNGTYYGYVEPPGFAKIMNVTVHFSNICNKYRTDAYADDVLVVWFAQGKIVGWYKHAKVFENIQTLSENTGRVYDTYNIISNETVLVPLGQREVWVVTWRSIYYPTYDRDKIFIERILAYIDKYESYLNFVAEKSNDELNYLDESKLVGEDIDHLAKYRRNQEAFRWQLVRKYDGKCSIHPCGIGLTDVLIASHIKPWRDSDCNEKLNVCNGLLLCPNHDKLFDKGYITFDDNGKIIISDELKKNYPHLFNLSDSSTIKVDNSMKPFLAYHRNSVFRGKK